MICLFGLGALVTFVCFIVSGVVWYHDPSNIFSLLASLLWGAVSVLFIRLISLQCAVEECSDMLDHLEQLNLIEHERKEANNSPSN